MRPLTEAEVRGSFVNARDDEAHEAELPLDFVLTDWDHLDFLAWRDPGMPRRAYVIVERDDVPVGVVLRGADAGRARAGMCNLCHTMQPGAQVAMYAARRAGARGDTGAVVGTYICADLSCHDNVRLAVPLTAHEVRGAAQVDRRIDGARTRTEAFVARVLGAD